MPSLSEITDPQAVQSALDEFAQLGRQAFLSVHALEPSRDYFVLHDGQMVDSKPILSVAYSYQYPERGLLPVSEFSGGAAAAARALTRLGFEVATRAQVNPPALGAEYPNRTAIYEAFGGDKMAGIIRFPGADIVNVFSDASGPYADDPPTLTEPFGYRGEGLNGPQRVEAGGNAYLEQARTSQSAVRFWYRPLGEPFTFLAWAVVLGRAWTSGVGQNGVERPELVWELQATTSAEPASWPAYILATIEEAAASTDTAPDGAEAKAGASYGDLVGRVNARGQDRRPSGVVRVDYPRSAAARRAVLQRCGGKCESPKCTGMPAETNRQGAPILDVDHIVDLALKGADHPLNMVALCPNCHASKTRGKHVSQWRKELTKVAADAHEAALAHPK